MVDGIFSDAYGYLTFFGLDGWYFAIDEEFDFRGDAAECGGIIAFDVGLSCFGLRLFAFGIDYIASEADIGW